MSDTKNDDDRRQEMARQRTDTAFRRTFLAEQRTYSAWVRTGLASAATGFALAKLMSDVDPRWLVQSLAVVFVVAGAAMFLLAFWSYRDAIKRLQSIESHGVPIWIFALLSLLLFGSAAAGLFLLLPA